MEVFLPKKSCGVLEFKVASDISWYIPHAVHRSGQIVKSQSSQAALMAAPLAAKQSVPLILDDGSDLTSIFTELKITDVTYVGSDGWSFGGVTVSTLHTAGDVFSALGKPEYLAVVNPADQSMSPFQSLSLGG